MRLRLSTLLSVDLVLLNVTGGVPWRRFTLLPAAARREPACGRFGPGSRCGSPAVPEECRRRNEGRPTPPARRICDVAKPPRVL
ncbi:hypothetical protein MTO96_019061 [Rhipicephalus appendiculatus]